MKLMIWVDPICPWCWMTARWLVDSVQPQRDITIEWQTISLLIKNQPDRNDQYFEPMVRTHELLRVMTAVRNRQGNASAGSFYWAAATMIHHDRRTDLTAADVLAAAELDPTYEAATADDSLDTHIETSMNTGLDLVGTDVGTPILAFTDETGQTRGVFGPVLSVLPAPDESGRIWDAMVTLAQTEGFWELKRTRTVNPSFPNRPELPAGFTD